MLGKVSLRYQSPLWHCKGLISRTASLWSRDIEYQPPIKLLHKVVWNLFYFTLILPSESAAVFFCCFLPWASHVCNITGRVLLFAVFTMVSKSRETQNDVGCRFFFFFCLFCNVFWESLRHACTDQEWAVSVCEVRYVKFHRLATPPQTNVPLSPEIKISVK